MTKTMKTIINTINAPNPIGPYNQAVLKNDTLYMSGQIAINPITNELITTDITSETIQVMENIKAILKEANMEFEHIIKCTIFISNMNDFQKINEIYGSYFHSNYPARETVQVSCLPKNVNVEISVIAIR